MFTTRARYVQTHKRLHRATRPNSLPIFAQLSVSSVFSIVRDCIERMRRQTQVSNKTTHAHTTQTIALKQ
jgi:hypothetical protein